VSVRSDVAARLAGQRAAHTARCVFRLQDQGRDGEWFTVDLRAGQPAEVVAGELPAWGCRVRLTTQDAERLLAGRLNPLLAYATKRIQVEGDVAAAIMVGRLLQNASPPPAPVATARVRR
jgi:hypothetical protein